ncbi:FKBP-type peptidyl-prolyl cis-trans isomerase SlyD [Paramagnetospirillum magnetotacticum MS-1]|uniref:peptidylprolyl isomerase n=1 Tax=Paramagnetospirillum magnetotacticum MS-1 TaxID=272627 RepID=A0A0C2UYK1_PARME|nr:FKBP-type peptidyl-prolyl cis-trans isomerase [Paramagnetospirillum magnetotacticum]KIL97906.1 FKBP-type peptidyl-prolyl cis-trans isomerase SlyD [Paramagnetospirillum magnetotacticum MS-1]
MKIEGNVVVTLRLKVTSLDGVILDQGAEPIRYLHGGHGGLLPKLEAALDGKSVGECIQVTLAPEDGFGTYDAALVTAVSPDCVEAPAKVGETLEREYEGVALPYRVIAVDDRNIQLDANHPLAGKTLVFSATVMDVRSATPEEIAAEIAALNQAMRDVMVKNRAIAQSKAEAESAAEAAILAEAEAAGLVESTYLPQLGTRLRFVFRSQTHKLCWLAPLFLLPAVAAWLGYHGWEISCGVIVALWIAWSFAAPSVIGKAIKRWGYQFLFFDFSPNLNPSRLENAISFGGGLLSVLAVLVYTVVALFHMERLSDLLTIIGLDLAILFALGIPLMVLLPFLVMVLTAFRVRPVVDKDLKGLSLSPEAGK